MNPENLKNLTQNHLEGLKVSCIGAEIDHDVLILKVDELPEPEVSTQVAESLKAEGFRWVSFELNGEEQS